MREVTQSNARRNEDQVTKSSGLCTTLIYVLVSPLQWQVDTCAR